jgi:Lon protease-like protein
MAESIERVCDHLPVFPLPRVVLMPGAQLPLHVFEPRYRALVKYCLEHDAVMGVATLSAGPASEVGEPALHPHLGVGRLVHHRALPDGRYNIVVSFLAAARILGEHFTDRPFRVIRAAPHPLAPSATGLGALRVLLMQVASTSEVRNRDEAERIAQLPDDSFLDTLARRVLVEPAERLSYLAADSGKRLAIVKESLALALLQGGTEHAEA